MITKTNGISLALLTALFSGLAVFVNKFGVSLIQPALTYTAWKNAGVGLVILGLLLFSGKWRKIKELNTKQRCQLLLISFVGGALPFYLFFTGLTQVPALNAALIHKTLVLWVVLLAIPLLQEKLNLKQLFAIIILFESNLIIGGFSSFKFSQGEMMILVATILWAGENILAKKILKAIDVDLVIGARMIIGSLVLVTASLISNPQSLTQLFTLSIQQWLIMASTIGLLFGYVTTWYRALQQEKAITVASVLVSATLVTNLLSALFISHSLNYQLMLQFGLTVIGIWLFFRQLKPDENQHLNLKTV